MNTWWPPRGYSDTLRERRMSVWGTRRILAFTDIYAGASHSDDPNNSRFVSGYLYVFAGGPVTWSSKKQPVVALSSCESEYIALAYASQKAVYLSDLLSELTYPPFSSSVQMYMGALQLSGTTAFSSRTKNICTRYHLLRELVASNKIIVSHVKTTDC